MNIQAADGERKILTVPNLLSLLRLGLILPILRLYAAKKRKLAVGLLLLSGLTDIADGFLARHFQMTSRLGKVLDPVADKLTQAAILLCLCTHYPLMRIPLLLMVIKETYMVISGCMVLQATGAILGAQWHGKVATVLLYIMLAVHMIWSQIPAGFSNLLVMLCTGMIGLSFMLYARRNIPVIRGAGDADDRADPQAGSAAAEKHRKNYRTRLGVAFIKCTTRLFYPRFSLEGTEHLPQEPCILVANHSQIHGPIVGELYVPGKRLIWCNWQMTDRKELPGYMFEDFWSGKPGWTHWFYQALAYVLTPVAAFTFQNADIIPVYRDARLINTFRDTVSALEEGTNVLIFPECYDEHNHIVHAFQDRFVDVARFYYKKTGKTLCFVPMYIAPKLRRVCFGEPLQFRPDVPIVDERRRICGCLMDSITRIAEALPRHRVVPYPNIAKKDYPYNTDGEDQQHEAAGG